MRLYSHGTLLIMKYWFSYQSLACSLTLLLRAQPVKSYINLATEKIWRYRTTIPLYFGRLGHMSHLRLDRVVSSRSLRLRRQSLGAVSVDFRGCPTRYLETPFVSHFRNGRKETCHPFHSIWICFSIFYLAVGYNIFSSYVFWNR